MREVKKMKLIIAIVSNEDSSLSDERTGQEEILRDETQPRAAAFLEKETQR